MEWGRNKTLSWKLNECSFGNCQKALQWRSWGHLQKPGSRVGGSCCESRGVDTEYVGGQSGLYCRFPGNGTVLPERTESRDQGKVS